MPSPAATELYQQANAAFVDEDYDAALDLYTRALEEDSTNPDFLLKRAAVHAKLAQHAAARDDATRAATLAAASGAQDLAARAHLRRGVALAELGFSADARAALEEAKALGCADRLLDAWLKKLPAAAAAPAPAPAPAAAAPVVVPLAAAAPAAAPSAAPSTQFLNTSKIRHEWFQNENFVTVSIFIKNLKPEAVSVELVPRACCVTIKLPTADYMLNLDPLAHAIVPAESKHSVLGTKVEIKLKKEKIGVRWGVLEGDEEGAPLPLIAAASDAKPTYPSSAKKKHDWDAVTRSVEEEKPEGEAALNSLFQKIYKDASEDTRRAMMKSYVESNGTCLSTNWDEVGKGRVETTPPEGMVAKKYEN
ncbi:Cochaperone protein [Cladochytrium tenue]|nr:Cochaperone protein [Cladochytrium tenue]